MTVSTIKSGAGAILAVAMVVGGIGMLATIPHVINQIHSHWSHADLWTRMGDIGTLTAMGPGGAAMIAMGIKMIYLNSKKEKEQEKKNSKID